MASVPAQRKPAVRLAAPAVDRVAVEPGRRTDDGRRLVSAKLSLDLGCNLAAFLLAGTCGIVLNILIGRHYGSSELGVFNQVYAVFILFSQLAVGGIHHSVLRGASRPGADSAALSSTLQGAMVAGAVLAGLVTTVYVLLAKPIGGLLDSPGVEDGIRLSAWGLFFFALNKILAGYVNGRGQLRRFAAIQAARPILYAATCLILIRQGCRGAELAAIFSCGEAVLCIGCLVLVLPTLWKVGRDWWSQAREHLAFGSKAMLSGLLVELNTRIDVLLLGIFTTDAACGIYSFAALFAEGLFQVLVVLRNLLSPTLSALLQSGAATHITDLAQRWKLRTFAGLTVVAIASAAAFPTLRFFAGDDVNLHAAHVIYVVLAVGIVVSSAYVPFGNLLLLANRPAAHTLMMLAIVAFNIVANLVLIPVWGVYGAAWAMAFTFVFSSWLLVILTRRLGYRL